jgi:hypothetical protein
MRGVTATDICTRPPCVIDARLALSRYGQLSVARLTREFPVWVPRELQRVLHDTRSYLSGTSRLAPRPYCHALRRLDMNADAGVIGEELSQWDRLPEEDDLASLPLHHLGDRADECSVPPNVDRRVRERFEQLQQGLHIAMAKSSYDLPRGQLVAACVADAAALCAALEPYGAFILTRLESDAEGSPALCDYLDAWGVPTAEAPDAHEPLTWWLRDALARCGLAPLSWAGVPFTAVHVVVPGFPILGGADKGLDEDAVARLWKRASVFWHRV